MEWMSIAFLCMALAVFALESCGSDDGPAYAAGDDGRIYRQIIVNGLPGDLCAGYGDSDAGAHPVA
jgi:hypothetical protein